MNLITVHRQYTSNLCMYSIMRCCVNEWIRQIMQPSSLLSTRFELKRSTTDLKSKTKSTWS